MNVADIMTHLADRLSYFQESVIREMTRKAIEYDAINLSQGMPDYSPPEELTEGITEAIKNSEHQYTVTYGRNDLREKIASKYETYNKIQYDPEDEITITCGASEAIACSILSLLNPSDEIIVLEPWYENYVPITYLANGKPVFVKLSEKDFGIDEENFKNK
ncbi:MAG: pyridoxal phosphate-dependent aminotransferase, partial [Candidatus Heimdallarchaeota archaeon]|nr:pyridoxal phosphate-dependent aminotransferase [Candidatus Heimdallarchaeota archaeon]